MNWSLLTSFVNKDLVDPTQIHLEHRKRNIRSKYDYLSVRVKIDQYEYVFSRFNLSRYLMAIQLPPTLAVDISRRVKEEFVDKNKFEITQEELAQRVFELISDIDGSECLQRRFVLIQRFNLERIPLIIFISGTGFIGKSNLAFQLGERLNISTILQTDIVGALTSGSGDHLGRSLWYTKHNSSQEFMDEYHRACEIVKVGIEGDIIKTLKDGKPLIVEGIHLDPDSYLSICGQNSLIPLNGFKPEIFGTQVNGKGFILPMLITKPRIEIQTSIRSNIFASTDRRRMNLDVAAITDYAIALQEELEQKFPPEYKIDGTGPDAINRIHSLFLNKLESYYAKRDSLNPPEAIKSTTTLDTQVHPLPVDKPSSNDEPK